MYIVRLNVQTLPSLRSRNSIAMAVVSADPAKVLSPQHDLLVGCLGEELRSDTKKVSCAVHELREYYLIVGLMENIM